MKDVIFINSHPIQYFAPLYKYMNENGVKTKAWYCSDESIKGGLDKQFGVKVKWDIPLLEGYESQFYKNYSWKPSHSTGFFGLMNFGIIKSLFKIPPSIFVVHGWNYFSHLSVILLGKMAGHTVCLRCEMPLNQEVLKTGWKMNAKKFILKHIVFPRVNNFLYIGTQNRLFYKSYGIKDDQLVFCPYSVDDQRFRREKDLLKPTVKNLKEKFGIPVDAKVILYAGKYMDKKKPMDLLHAFKALNNPSCWLVMVGDGELRGEMEQFIKANNLQNILLTGFINQSQVAEYYAISDVFVMCSTIGETWGLSVNEAMNFGMPVVISHLTGCAGDMVINGDNGYVFETGNSADLALKLYNVLIAKKLTMKTNPEMLVDKHSYHTIATNIKLVSYK